MDIDRDLDKNIAIFDGDNTLWDTNAVFTDAQKNILRGIASAGISADPERDFDLLRTIDGLLVKHFEMHEYDNTYLALCLIRHLKGERVEDLDQVARIVSANDASDMNLAQKLGAAFVAASARVPSLVPEVAESLSLVQQTGRTLMVLYSEGREERIGKICEHHGMSKYFHHIVLGDKSLDDWFRVKDRVLCFFNERYPDYKKQPQLYVIGDRLERDIKPGNLIGAKTIYKPGGYMRMEKPRDEEHEPAITVRSMREVVEFLCRF